MTKRTLSEINTEIKSIIKNTPMSCRNIPVGGENMVWENYWKNNTTEKDVQKIDTGLTHWRNVFLKYLKPNDKIIDAGCGLAKWVLYLKAKGYDIIGVEREEEVVKQIPTNICVSVGDVEKLAFPDNSFDSYISGGVIEHFIDGPQRVLLEAKRVLRPDGLLFLSVPIRTPIANFYYIKLQIKTFAFKLR